MGPLRVLLVDDTESVRAVLSRLFDMEESFELVGAAVNGEEAVTMALELRPDVVVMDAMMPVMDGRTATLELKKRMPEVVVVGFTSSSEHSTRMLAAGAYAAIEKADVEGLFEALHSVQRPETS